MDEQDIITLVLFPILMILLIASHIVFLNHICFIISNLFEKIAWILVYILIMIFSISFIRHYVLDIKEILSDK